MKKKDYDALKSMLVSDCERIVDSLKGTEDVYAFVMVCDFEAAKVSFCVNDMASHDAATSTVEAIENEGLFGLRHQSQHFAHQFSICEGAATKLDAYTFYVEDNKSKQTIKRHAELLRETLLDVIPSAKDLFAGLNQSSEFVAYARPTEAPLIDMTQLTVSEQSFRVAFPEIESLDRKMNELPNVSGNERAAFWMQAAQDVGLSRGTLLHRRLQSLSLGLPDISDRLVEVPEAIDQLLPVVSELGLKPELNERDTPAYEKDGRFTAEGRLFAKLMLTVPRFELSDAHVETLHTLLKNIYADRPSDGVIGMNLQICARALSSCRPDRFPKAEVKVGDNQLLNATEFGLTD